MLQNVKQRRVIIDLVECDMPEGLRRYKVRVSLIHPDRGVIQLIEACGASDQEYCQQSNDERPIGQVMPRDVAGCCVGTLRWRQYCRKQSKFPYNLPQRWAIRPTGATWSTCRCRMQDIYLMSYQARKLIFIISPGYGPGLVQG